MYVFLWSNATWKNVLIVDFANVHELPFANECGFVIFNLDKNARFESFVGFTLFVEAVESKHLKIMC